MFDLEETTMRTLPIVTLGRWPTLRMRELSMSTSLIGNDGILNQSLTYIWMPRHVHSQPALNLVYGTVGR